MPSVRYLLATVGALTLAGSAVTPAAAAAPPPVVTTAVILGDLTGDGLVDQITLGTNPSTPLQPCVARLRPGRVGGGFGAADYLPLPVTSSTPVLACPDLGVVLAGPVAARNRLAVTFSEVAPVGGRSVQLFSTGPTGWTSTGGFTGMVQPSTIRTVDADGDGYGDVWEQSDQGTGVALYVGRNSAYTLRYSSAPSVDDGFTFANFDHGPGTDVLDAHDFFGLNNVGVTVVDGATGHTVTLVSAPGPDAPVYVATVVDLDHDGWPDVRVRVTGRDGTPYPTLQFRNTATGTLAFTPWHAG